MRRVHMCVSISGVLKKTDAQLKRDHCKWITRDDGSTMTPQELREWFMVWRNEGFEAVPTCDWYDERGHCKGHEQSEAES